MKKKKLIVDTPKEKLDRAFRDLGGDNVHRSPNQL